MFLFQLINQQMFTPWRKMITIGILGKHYKNMQKTDRRKAKSIIYEGKKLLKNYQLMIEFGKFKKMKHLLQ